MFWIGFIIGFASSIPWRTIQLNSETNLTRNYALEQYQEGILQTNILLIIVIIIIVITTIIIIITIISSSPPSPLTSWLCIPFLVSASSSGWSGCKSSWWWWWWWFRWMWSFLRWLSSPVKVIIINDKNHFNPRMMIFLVLIITFVRKAMLKTASWSASNFLGISFWKGFQMIVWSSF